jgi:nicotinate dehydrogenase subunit B
MAGWNLLFLDHRLYQPDFSRTARWNRGKYLVDGAGHCGACHTSRNALGAERSGTEHYLSGGVAEGWEAPALNVRSNAPLPWTEADLYQYLRSGFSPRHGVAAGPMGPVIAGLDALPDSDIRAMANYLSSLTPASVTAGSPVEQENSTVPKSHLPGGQGERIFQGACAACHEVGQGPTMFGSKPSLALNTNLYSDRPDNLLQVVLQGISNPAHGELGYMPGFRDSLSDLQIAELAKYMRLRFAPDKPAWTRITEKLQRIRRQHVEPFT